MGFKRSPFPMIKGTEGHKKETKKATPAAWVDMAMSAMGSMGGGGGGGGESEDPKKSYDMDIPGSKWKPQS